MCDTERIEGGRCTYMMNEPVAPFLGLFYGYSIEFALVNSCTTFTRRHDSSIYWRCVLRNASSKSHPPAPALWLIH